LNLKLPVVDLIKLVNASVASISKFENN